MKILNSENSNKYVFTLIVHKEHKLNETLDAKTIMDCLRAAGIDEGVVCLFNGIPEDRMEFEIARRKAEENGKEKVSV